MLSEVRFEGVHKIFGTENAVEDLNLTVNAGRLQQVDAPETLYDNPANLFVAGFIGSPRMNFVPGRLTESQGQAAVEVLGVRASLSAGSQLTRETTDGEGTRGLRPGDLIWRRAAGP